MSPLLRKGLLVGLIHVLMVAGLGGKYLVDRATRPRVWARTVPVDPNLPIRGRYVRLRVEADARELTPGYTGRVALAVRDDLLVAQPTGIDTGSYTWRRTERGSAIIEPPLAYFIPEHAQDPSIRPPGEELWVELTLPRRGAPRPIRLGVKKNGVLTPIP